MNPLIDNKKHNSLDKGGTIFTVGNLGNAGTASLSSGAMEGFITLGNLEKAGKLSIEGETGLLTENNQFQNPVILWQLSTAKKDNSLNVSVSDQINVNENCDNYLSKGTNTSSGIIINLFKVVWKNKIQIINFGKTVAVTFCIQEMFNLNLSPEQILITSILFNLRDIKLLNNNKINLTIKLL